MFIPQRYLQVLPPSRENPSYRVDSLRGGIPATELCSHLLSSGEIPSTELRTRAFGKGKSLQLIPVSEWGNSHSEVSWQDVGEFASPLPSGGNPISGRALEVVRMNIQAHNKMLNKILNANVGKTGCMSLAHDL